MTDYFKMFVGSNTNRLLSPESIRTIEGWVRVPNMGSPSNTAESQRIRNLDELDVIVDTDAHIRETIDDLLPYIDDQYEGAKWIVERTEHPERDIYSLTHSLPPSLHAERGGWSADTNTVDKKLNELDEFNIDYGIVDPGLNLVLPTVNNERIAVALTKAYNNWLLDNFLDEGNHRLKANLLVSHHRPEMMAEEIDRMAGEKDIVGVAFPSTGVIPPAGHDRYDPIYQAAEDNGLPVFFHGASTNTSHVFPLQRMYNQTYTEDHVIIHPFSQMWNLSSLIFQGAPERFPDLDFVFQESGVGWIPYLMWRMDDHYLEMNYELPLLEKMPSEYIHDQIYFTTQPLGHTEDNPRHLAMAIEMAGPNNIMYSSDLPHSDFDPPSELFNRIRGHFDRETVENIMGETARELLDL
ncbi:amidohydrolase family protein [Natronosalvus caseinilyticus]|uniref:amidohydrolase family protein n=1 Tax=Natronosalvus caseinilyticus TaxID=2953747 RepID=UPI0028AAA899|nr:amidohydrolase family protein [Natronosalvus caseinilyticus]